MAEETARRLAGKPVAEALNQRTAAAAQALRARGVTPTLAILRVGGKDSDSSYERGAVKCCESVGIECRRVQLSGEVSQAVLMRALRELNEAEDVHGILPLLPLPQGLDGEELRHALCVKKDVDGVTDASLTALFTGKRAGFAPCTAQAVLEILDHYGIECAGRHVVVLGRSLVVGRPLSALLLGRHATVTQCHSRSRNVAALTGAADMVVAAAGQMQAFGKEYFAPGQVVLDVGIHWDAQRGKLCGDVRTEEAAEVVAAITPVPGGVGAVTSAVLASHVVQAARQAWEA